MSDFPLIGVHACHDEAADDDAVMIRRGSIPDGSDSAAAMFREGRHIAGSNGKEVLLDFPNVGRFLVRDGNEILVESAPGSDEGEVRAYLFGTAFGVLCHQRGIAPLHASAIDTADGCVAFVGPSGAGKSTLVAALARLGHEVIADDVCFLQLDSKGNLGVRPGIGRIRLWEEAIHALGCAGPGVEREMHGYNKYFVPVRQLQNPFEHRRLHRVYELHPTPNGASTMTPLHGTAAVEVLMQNIYRLGLAECLGYKPRAFAVCAAAARDVPVFRFSRPKDFTALEKAVEFLVAHLQTTI
jgi:energy-coupling factor transporter ATP-binding protein EcfA2